MEPGSREGGMTPREMAYAELKAIERQMEAANSDADREALRVRAAALQQQLEKSDAEARGEGQGETEGA